MPIGPYHSGVMRVRTPRSLQSWRVAVASLALLGATISPSRASAAEDPAATRYAEQVQPILEQYCYGCHGMGTKKGDVALDEFADGSAALQSPELWHRVLKNLRAGIMPPPGKPR